MSKVLDCHEQTLQEIQKQLQTLNSFMQRIAENEERCLNSPNNGSRALQIGNTTNLESSSVCTIKNLKLDFPRFHGEDPTCWISKPISSFHSMVLQNIRKYLWLFMILMEKLSSSFKIQNKQVALLVGRSLSEPCKPVLVP